MRGSDKAVSDYMRLWAVCEVAIQRQNLTELELKGQKHFLLLTFFCGVPGRHTSQ